MRLPLLYRTALLIVWASASASVQAAPVLYCQLNYGGETQTIEARLSADPYHIPLTDVGGRFKFKAAMIGQDERIDYIKLYAYFQTWHGDVPIQQASYAPPFPQAAGRLPLGPHTMLYAGELERELQYDCTLENPLP